MAEKEVNASVRPEPPVVRKTRAMLNRWSLFGLIAVSAFFTIVYVNNVIRVNDLLRQSQASDRSIDSLKAVNHELYRQIAQLQSVERITKIATEKLNMIYPPSAPKTLNKSKN